MFQVLVLPILAFGFIFWNAAHPNTHKWWTLGFFLYQASKWCLVVKDSCWTCLSGNRVSRDLAWFPVPALLCVKSRTGNKASRDLAKTCEAALSLHQCPTHSSDTVLSVSVEFDEILRSSCHKYHCKWDVVAPFGSNFFLSHMVDKPISFKTFKAGGQI